MSNRAKITQVIKSILDELRIEYSKVMIFGSKERGDFGEDAKKDLWLKIYRKFHEHLVGVEDVRVRKTHDLEAILNLCHTQTETESSEENC